MAKKHIIHFQGYHYSMDSISSATEAVKILSKLKPCRLITSGGYHDCHYIPEDRDLFRDIKLELTLNEDFREPRKPKAEKPLALPKPKRGTILCICERSSVAPGQTCAHCGRSFAESHNRTHGDDSSPKLRLL
jgi:hypothetical protein